MMRRPVVTAILAAACGVSVMSLNLARGQTTQPSDEVDSAIKAADKVSPSTQPEGNPATQPATQPVEPKPLSQNVHRGLKWLADHQLASGGWGQGPESSHMQRANQGGQNQEQANVGDTCMAALALMRAGSTPLAGEHATNIRRAVEFVCEQVEKSDEQSLWITDIRGTRIQSKLGNYVDTFLAALLLAEVKDRMPEEAMNQRVLAALDKTMDKIQRNQQDNGAWANEGWAPALAQGLASKCINRAAQRGAPVDEKMRKLAEKYAQGNFDRARGVVATGGAAGVELYAVSSNIQSIKDSDDTNQIRLGHLKQVLAEPTTRPEDRAAAAREIDQIKENNEALADATGAVVQRLDDKQFVAGFGSNGGEEFLSYMNIGETLVAKGGVDWEKWDKSMTENLDRIQSDDGSWSGHHCITGQTFCTSAALMVLMTDRPTTAPIAAEIKKS